MILLIIYLLFNINIVMVSALAQTFRRISYLLTALYKHLKMVQRQKIMEQIEGIDNSKDNSGRMYKAVKAITANKPEKPLPINTEKIQAADATAQVKIISNHFNTISMFWKKEMVVAPEVHSFIKKK